MPNIEIKLNDICIAVGIFAIGYAAGEIHQSIKISKRIEELYAEGYVMVDTNTIEVTDFDVK
jgi:hypothetical protein